MKLQSLSVSLDSQCEVEQRFYRLAIILAASVDIAKYCKPVISFDSGALKHACWPGYQVMVMGMQDGEKRDVLVGIAIVPTLFVVYAVYEAKHGFRYVTILLFSF